jgi:predicted GNAT family N-acyltransferase
MVAESPMHFALVENQTLISHASVNWRNVEHRGETFNVQGLSAVFTFPAWRKGGHGKHVVQAASDFIRTSQADLAMLFCAQALRDFYKSCGWTPADKAKILYGEKLRPQLKHDNLVMMMFVSEKARDARGLFEREEVYVGESTW